MGFVDVLEVPGAERAFAWEGAPTVYVRDDGVALELGDNRPLGVTGARTLAYSRGPIFEAFDWFWLDFENGAVESVEQPLTHEFVPLDTGASHPGHASPNGRAFAVPDDTSPANTTHTWLEGRGWQTVPWHVHWIGDDGSMITAAPAAWRDAEGEIIAALGDGEVWLIRQSGDRVVLGASGKTWMLDLRSRTAREISADPSSWYVFPEGQRFTWTAGGSRWLGTL